MHHRNISSSLKMLHADWMARVVMDIACSTAARASFCCSPDVVRLSVNLVRASRTLLKVENSYELDSLGANNIFLCDTAIKLSYVIPG